MIRIGVLGLVVETATCLPRAVTVTPDTDWIVPSC